VPAGRPTSSGEDERIVATPSAAIRRPTGKAARQMLLAAPYERLRTQPDDIHRP
jgi:hypothetical protein